MKNKLQYGFFLLLLLPVFSLGCAKQETPVGMFYGTSYELARQSQVYNQQAGVNAGPPVGLEGSVGTRVMDRYHKGFEQKAAKTTTYSIDVEGSSAKSN